MDLSKEERQKILELIDKVSPCTAISKKENLEKFKEWLDSDRSKRSEEHSLNSSHSSQSRMPSSA